MKVHTGKITHQNIMLAVIAFILLAIICNGRKMLRHFHAVKSVRYTRFGIVIEKNNRKPIRLIICNGYKRFSLF